MVVYCLWFAKTKRNRLSRNARPFLFLSEHGEESERSESRNIRNAYYREGSEEFIEAIGAAINQKFPQEVALCKAHERQTPFFFLYEHS